DRVAADAVQREIGDAERCLAADGGVERVASALQNAPGHFGRLRLHRRNGSLASAKDRPHRGRSGGLVVLCCGECRAAEEECRDRNADERFRKRPHKHLEIQQTSSVWRRARSSVYKGPDERSTT